MIFYYSMRYTHSACRRSHSSANRSPAPQPPRPPSPSNFLLACRRRKAFRKAELARLPCGGQVCSRLSASHSLIQGLISTARRRGRVCSRLTASRGLSQGRVCTPRRRGLPFAPAKGSKTGSRGRFPLDEPPFVACSAGYERCEASSVLRTDTLQRCLRRIFIAPALERGRANHHPCPLL